MGREIEASGSISIRAISEVLGGRRSYDQLDVKEQAVVRAEWAERMNSYRETLDLPRRFTAEGRSWVELDDSGNIVERSPSSVPRGGATKGSRTGRRSRSA